MSDAQTIDPGVTCPPVPTTVLRARAVVLEDRRRRDVRILSAAMRAAFDEYESAVMLTISRARRWLDDLEPWTAGGPVPESARRYRALFDAQDTIESCGDCGSAKCPQCSAFAALEEEFWGGQTGVSEQIYAAMSWATRCDSSYTLEAALEELTEHVEAGVEFIPAARAIVVAAKLAAVTEAAALQSTLDAEIASSVALAAAARQWAETEDAPRAAQAHA